MNPPNKGYQQNQGHPRKISRAAPGLLQKYCGIYARCSKDQRSNGKTTRGAANNNNNRNSNNHKRPDNEDCRLEFFTYAPKVVKSANDDEPEVTEFEVVHFGSLR